MPKYMDYFRIWTYEVKSQNKNKTKKRCKCQKDICVHSLHAMLIINALHASKKKKKKKIRGEFTFFWFSFFGFYCRWQTTKRDRCRNPTVTSTATLPYSLCNSRQY